MDDTGTEASSSDDDESSSSSEASSDEDNPDSIPITAPRFRTRQTARKCAPSLY